MIPDVRIWPLISADLISVPPDHFAFDLSSPYGIGRRGKAINIRIGNEFPLAFENIFM